MNADYGVSAFNCIIIRTLIVLNLQQTHSSLACFTFLKQAALSREGRELDWNFVGAVGWK